MQLRIADRWVRPLALSQVAVYADVLEGVPNREINARIIERAVETATRLHGLEPALITPPQRVVGQRASQVVLPRVRCIGRFRSDEPARDPNAERSEACVVWFQERFAFPVDPDAEAAMRELDWVAIAKDDFM